MKSKAKDWTCKNDADGVMKRVWNSIYLSTLRGLVESMSRRCELKLKTKASQQNTKDWQIWNSEFSRRDLVEKTCQSNIISVTLQVYHFQRNYNSILRQISWENVLSGFHFACCNICQKVNKLSLRCMQILWDLDSEIDLHFELHAQT